MSKSSIDAQFDLLESNIHDLGVCLVGSDPIAVQTCSAKLQQLAVELFQICNGIGQGSKLSSHRARRIKGLVHATACLRENLLRRLAYVDRTLEIVVPVTREKSTYAGGGVYGKPVRQSGAFSVLSA